jgi:hypothetical protein
MTVEASIARFDRLSHAQATALHRLNGKIIMTFEKDD